MKTCKTPEHYTPPYVFDRGDGYGIRNVLRGSIELDPASCDEANAIVKAETYYTQEHDGLNRPWLSRSLWCNPPGTRKGYVVDGVRYHMPAVWWAKLVQEFEAGHVKQAAFLLYSVTSLRGCALMGCTFPTRFPILWPYKRLSFDGPTAKQHPMNESAIVLLGDVDFRWVDSSRWRLEVPR